MYHVDVKFFDKQKQHYTFVKWGLPDDPFYYTEWFDALEEAKRIAKTHNKVCRVRFNSTLTTYVYPDGKMENEVKK